MFTITNGTGFHLTFANGFTVSVQWGPGNYCDRRAPWDFGPPPTDSTGRPLNWDAQTAEVAVFDPSGDFIPLPNGDDVSGHHDPDFVARLIAWTAQQVAPADRLPAPAAPLAIPRHDGNA